MNFKDIPQFPFASYKIDVNWSFIREWIKQREEFYDVDLSPSYQRNHVWSDFQKTSYIEYQLKGGFSGRDIF